MEYSGNLAELPKIKRWVEGAEYYAGSCVSVHIVCSAYLAGHGS